MVNLGTLDLLVLDMYDIAASILSPRHYVRY
jgi:hypothetical protein